MRIAIGLIGLLIIGTLSCTDSLEDTVSGVETALLVSASCHPMSKAQVDGVSLPDGGEMGVFLTSSDGTMYDGLTTYNVKYTASGSGDEQVWSPSSDRYLRLTKTIGTAYAYYPWRSNVTGGCRVLITNDGTDWMYSSPVTNLSVEHNLAQFEMIHAMSIIRCKVLRGTYTGTGEIASMSVTSEALAKEAVIDLIQSDVTDFVGAGTRISAPQSALLGEEPAVTELWAVPTGINGTLTIDITVDGDLYRATMPNFLGVPGTVHDFTIKVNSPEMG